MSLVSIKFSIIAQHKNVKFFTTIFYMKIFLLLDDRKSLIPRVKALVKISCVWNGIFVKQIALLVWIPHKIFLSARGLWERDCGSGSAAATDTCADVILP